MRNDYLTGAAPLDNVDALGASLKKGNSFTESFSFSYGHISKTNGTFHQTQNTLKAYLLWQSITQQMNDRMNTIGH